MKPLKIALGDLAYLNEANRHNLYTPLNVGYLASTAKSWFGRDVSIRIFKDPEALLQHAREDRPHLVGLAAYYWNDRLNDLIGRRLRREMGTSTTIVVGGPSIDTDKAEAAQYLRDRPWIDMAVPNEGEDAFCEIVGAMLGGGPPGEKDIGIGLSTDLAKVPSPYLDGTLDEFLAPGLPYQPLVQTSRLCPYTCSFCVSGKSRGKLRAFPLEQVREELRYVCSRYTDRPDLILYMVDENFGILARDREVAAMIQEEHLGLGFPQRLFYYNDKRFTQVSRDVHEVVGHLCHHGVTLSLQSENPETLKAIRRRNLTDEEVRSAIGWAKGLGLKSSTELIFGLPMETRESFLGLLDKCATVGFDAIQCYNLIVFDGIEMNRRPYREAHEMQTMRRLIWGNHGVIDGERVVESEEIVVSTTSYSEETYRLVRALTVFFHAIYVLGVKRAAVDAAVAAGIPLTSILTRLITVPTSDAHAQFLGTLECAISDELMDAGRLSSITAGFEPMPPMVKIHPVLGKRLADEVDAWVGLAFDMAIWAETYARGQTMPSPSYTTEHGNRTDARGP